MTWFFVAFVLLPRILPFIELIEAREWKELPELGLADRIGLQIRATTDTGQATTRLLRIPPVEPKPPLISYWNAAREDWINAGRRIPAALGSAPVMLKLRAIAGGAETRTSISLPAKQLPAQPSTPTIQIRETRNVLWKAAKTGSQVELSGNPGRLHIRASADGEEATTYVMLRSKTQDTRPPVVTLTARDQRSGKQLRPTQRGDRVVYLVSEPAQLTSEATANGQSASSTVTVLPRAAAAPEPPTITATVLKSSGDTLTVRVRHSEAGRRLVNGTIAERIPGFRNERGGYTIDYRLSAKEPQPRIVFSMLSPDGIQASTTVVPVVIREPSRVPERGTAPGPPQQKLSRRP